jgi:hypothetical protein
MLTGYTILIKKIHLIISMENGIISKNATGFKLFCRKNIAGVRPLA